MNRNLLKPLFAAALLLGPVAVSVNAQRYLTEVFDAVNIQTDVQYGSNFTVLTGTPMLQPLLMDVYTPEGDEETDRPLIVYLHTGSFLPRYLNQLPTGAKGDSATVEMCRRFAKKGYVVAAISYRQGWNPALPSEELRKQSIIRAVYRALQDAKTAVRYFRRSVAEQENPYGINGAQVVIGGQGSGGYAALAYATLQDVSEIQLLKFFNTETGQFMIDPAVMGDYEGLGGDPALNQDNHPGFSSDITMVFNIGGALGDSSWMDPGEVPICSIHAVHDPFAPYGNGTVFVPGTPFAVVNVDGSSRVTELAHEYGNNDIWLDPPFTDPITVYAQNALQGTVNEGQEGLFPITALQNSSGPWEWWSEAVVTAGATTVGADPQVVINNGYQSNPVFQALGYEAGRQRALAYIDTLQGFITPRMHRALGFAVGIRSFDMGHMISLHPNPASDRVYINSELTIRNFVIYDQQGRIVRNGRIDAPQAVLDRKGLHAGSYFIELHFDEGRTTRKLILD